MKFQDERLSKVVNPNLILAYRNYPGANHMRIVNRSMEEAMQMVFFLL